MENKYKVNCNLSVLDYVSMANDIAECYFDDDGTYTPHIGRINAMRLFYNRCVIEGKPEGIETIDSSIEDMDRIVSDKDFVEIFEESRYPNTEGLVFGNAYADALEIVDSKRNSLMDTVVKFADRLGALISEDNIENFSSIAKDIASGNINSKTIADAYIESDKFDDKFGKA